MLFSLEGNIGAGKSTLLKRIVTTFEDSYIYPERINEWSCVRGRKTDYNLLYLGVKDPINYCFPLQLTTLESHRQTIKIIGDKPGYHFCERSQISCQKVFTRFYIEQNNINDCEIAVYDNMISNMKNPDHILYLNTPTEICLQRIRKRNRPEEEQLDIDYLSVLHKYHQEWLSKEEEIPITILHYENNVKQIMNTIRTVLSQHI